MNIKSITKVLFLAANPKNSTLLRLDEELREIDEGLQRAKYRDQFALEQKWAVRPGDVQRAILDLNPQIVHFSGHGLGTEGGEQSAQEVRKLSVVPETSLEPEGLVFEDDKGHVKLVDTMAIASLFELFADRIKCVVLNACYSEKQAKAIAQHIPYVIGMSRAVGDIAARYFAVGFYGALGAGRDIEFAYRSGCTAIKMQGIPEDRTPILNRKSDLSKLGKTEVQGNAKLTVSLESPDGQVRIDSGFYMGKPWPRVDTMAASSSGSAMAHRLPTSKPIKALSRA